MLTQRPTPLPTRLPTQAEANSTSIAEEGFDLLPSDPAEDCAAMRGALAEAHTQVGRGATWGRPALAAGQACTGSQPSAYEGQVHARTGLLQWSRCCNRWLKAQWPHAWCACCAI